MKQKIAIATARFYQECKKAQTGAIPKLPEGDFCLIIFSKAERLVPRKPEDITDAELLCMCNTEEEAQLVSTGFKIGWEQCRANMPEFIREQSVVLGTV